MPLASKRKTVSFPVTVWFVAETGVFHIARPTRDDCATTVCSDPLSERGHPHLFRKLSQIMCENAVLAAGDAKVLN